MPLWWRLRFVGRRPERAEVRDFILRRMPRGGTAAEIGVDKGIFSQRILELARPRKLYLIDPWFPDLTGAKIPSPEQRYVLVSEKFATHAARGIVEILREPSETAAIRFADLSLDWIYIDGDHHYEAVKRDLDLYFPKVKKGGFIICDDYHFAGNFDDGVTRAVDEFMTLGTCQRVFKRRSQCVMRKK
jgi:hypothetical protein